MILVIRGTRQIPSWNLLKILEIIERIDYSSQPMSNVPSIKHPGTIETSGVKELGAAPCAKRNCVVSKPDRAAPPSIQ